jgi:hypothetical protein
LGSASPRHSSRKRSAVDAPDSTSERSTRSVLPSASRADWAAIEMNCAERRRRSSRARSSEMSISLSSFHSAPKPAVTDWRSAGVFPVRPPPEYSSAAGRPGE